MQETKLKLLERIVDRRQDSLYRFAYICTGSQADAEDIVQDVLLRLFHSDCNLDRIDDVERYLWRAIANRCCDYHRHRRNATKAVLLIKYIGYKDVEKVVSPTMKIVMEEDSEMLEDVVVIGYGSVKKSDATGSVTAIKPDDFNKGLRTTAQDALVGKVPGVNVVSSSGAPGAGATIRIRSGASLSASNDPLIVVDGVPVDNSTIEGGGNVIGGINPNDIETFTVLKDASATAIYGSRASNGVIVITTKKGSDSNLRFNYSTNLSVSTITEKLDVLSADEFREFVPTVSGVPSSVTLGTASTDWQDEIYRTAFGQEHNFSVSGKVKKNARRSQKTRSRHSVRKCGRKSGRINDRLE